tara:strand:- start:8636 stop:8818 length:183 start_codon:yes stop_codon:yes gene_type:complete
MTLDEALNPKISLSDINTGKINFWELSYNQVDLAVLAEILKSDAELWDELENKNAKERIK